PLLVSLRWVDELSNLETNGQLEIGAMVTCGEIAWSDDVRKGWTGLVDGADLVGSVQIRNKGTVGGNVCNAAPSADVVPSLLVLGETARVAGPGGQRSLPLQELFRGPGQTALGAGEILVGVDVPK